MLYSREYYLSCWRFYFGATALGWHDRVKRTPRPTTFPFRRRRAKTRIQARTEPRSDPNLRYCHEGPAVAILRLAGRSAIEPVSCTTRSRNSSIRRIRDWRWTADPNQEDSRRPSNCTCSGPRNASIRMATGSTRATSTPCRPTRCGTTGAAASRNRPTPITAILRPGTWPTAPTTPRRQRATKRGRTRSSAHSTPCG